MADQADLVTGQSRSISPPQGTARSRFPIRVQQHMVGIGSMASDIFVLEWRQRSEPGYFMTVSAGSDETKVGMARCAVPAAFSGGTLRGRGHEWIARWSAIPRLH